MLKSEEIIFSTIERLKDPEKIEKQMIEVKKKASSDDWQELSLAEGYPGLLLLFAFLQENGLVDAKKENIAHQYVLKIKKSLEKKGIPDLSLFSGLSGICFALQKASCNGTRYQPMLQTLHALLVAKFKDSYLIPLKGFLSNNQPIPFYFYDIICGISGIGRYFLENISDKIFFKASQEICHHLIEMTNTFKIDGFTCPRWFVSINDPLNWYQKKKSSRGNFNFGLAHGITGVLAYLSIAYLKNVIVSNQKKTILNLAKWIQNHSINYESTIAWPATISFEELVLKVPVDKKRSKDAWCYGVPGIARTLFLAAKALNNKELKKFSIEAFKGVFCRSQEKWYLPGSGICHGKAGLLIIAKMMAKEDGCGDLYKNIKELEELLLSYYEEKTIFGFFDLEKNMKIGYLEGVCGILMSLFNLDINPKWHLPLMLHD